MGNFSIFTRRSTPMFWLQIRLGALLGFPPGLVAAALGCSPTTVRRHQKDLHCVIREANLTSCDEEERLAYGLLRAFYRAEGGAGAGSEEGWQQVLKEAEEDLLARVRGCCEATLARLDQIEAWSAARASILSSIKRPSNAVAPTSADARSGSAPPAPDRAPI